MLTILARALRLIANGYFTLIPRMTYPLTLNMQQQRGCWLFSPQWLAVTQTLSQDSNITHSSAYSHAVHDGLTSSTLHVENRFTLSAPAPILYNNNNNKTAILDSEYDMETKHCKRDVSI